MNVILKKTNILELSVSVPSSPTILSDTPGSTYINFNWFQPNGDVVEIYSISYTYNIIACGGRTEGYGNNTIAGIIGSARTY